MAFVTHIMGTLKYEGGFANLTYAGLYLKVVSHADQLTFSPTWRWDLSKAIGRWRGRRGRTAAISMCLI